MRSQTKNIILAVVVVGIVGAVWYLESKKPGSTLGPAQDVTVATTTAPLPGAPSGVGTTTSNAASIAAEVLAAARRKDVAAKAAVYPKAKELLDPTGFINTPPFRLSDYAGKKVILLDFWTYSCINCIRTLPYLKAWYAKYKDEGLLVVGIHTPEFEFEKDIGNVEKAVASFGITYPVVLDSNYGTWSAYGNQYWPHEYLIDIDGFVVHDHIGEGGYAETEKAIQDALNNRSVELGQSVTVDTSIVTPQDVIPMNGALVQSPETYFGSNRNQYLGNGTQGQNGIQNLLIPLATAGNTLYLDGPWNFTPEYAETTGESARIIYKYSAKNVYFVASSANGVGIKVTIDGKAPGALAGSDIKADGTGMIKDNRLYNLIQGSEYGEHTIEIDVTGKGLDAFTFTFG